MSVDVTLLMKKLYGPAAEKKVIEKAPILEFAKRDNEFTSRTKDYVVIQTNNNRVGSDYEMAKSGSAALETQFAVYSVPQKQLYGFSEINGQDFSNFVNGGSESYFLQQQEATRDQTLTSMAANAAECAFGSGKPILGIVGAGTSSPVTLSSVAAATLIYVGMALRFGPNADGSSLRSNTAVVTAVDDDQGIITYTGSVTPSVNDYIFPANDVSSGAAVAQGLEYYNGLTLGSSVNGVNQQTAKSFQVAGMRFNCNATATRRGFTMVDGINRAIALHTNAAKGGASIDVIFMNPVDVDRLQASRNGGLIVAKTDADAAYKKYNLSIEGFQFGGKVVIPDPFCPEGVARGLAKDAFVWLTCGNTAQLDNRDGLTWRQSSTGDKYQCNFFTYHNFVLQRPAGALRIQLPTTTG